uniref:Uncharacterized kinase-like protein D1044.1 n=1 Tax=Zeugodacus cucurbitae TaxID=28588 RepID=A0A0A1WRG4_ZEUCU
MCTNQTEATLPPSYLNADFIKQVLESHFNGAHDGGNNNKVEILECQFERATAEGENFCSVIYRAKVQFCLQRADAENSKNSNAKRNITVIVKDVLGEIAELGSNELVMYKHVLPEMQKILELPAEENKIGDGAAVPKFYATCYYSARDPREIYVLEDLNDAGYCGMNRYVGLDLEETKVVLKKLAIFHAASMKYIEKFPTESAALLPSTFANGFHDDVYFNAIVVGGITAAAKIVAEWENFEEIATKMRASVDKFDECAKRVIRTERCRFKVLTHGDLWANNVLMKYATVNGKQVPQDAVFVDFQMGFVGSCGYDINFFLNTSVQMDVLKLHRYELLRHYYAQLKETLKTLGTAATDIPTWQMIVEEVRDLELASYYALACELPLCCMDREGSVGLSLNSLIDPSTKEATHKKMFGNKRVLDMLRYELDRLNELGVLDL